MGRKNHAVTVEKNSILESGDFYLGHYLHPDIVKQAGTMFIIPCLYSTFIWMSGVEVIILVNFCVEGPADSLSVGGCLRVAVYDLTLSKYY